MAGTLQVSNVITGTGSGVDIDTLATDINSKLPLTGGTLTGELRIQSNTPTNSALEIGRIDGVASTPLIDFHSGSTATDYDSRIIASGGDGASGGGELTYHAARHNFVGEAQGSLFTAKNPTNNTATLAVGFYNDVARLRYGGTGVGSTNGFKIQGTGDAVKLSLSEAGDLSVPGGIDTTSGDPSKMFGVKFFSKSLTLTTAAQNLFTSGDGVLADGIYIVRAWANDYGVGGGHYNETYAGLMYWYTSTTNSTSSDEITLHRMGHAPNFGRLHLRTCRATGSISTNQALQIWGDTTNTGASTYNFWFKRIA